MKRRPMPFGSAVALFIVGLLLGSIFTFGMQYWNAPVTRTECTQIETRFVSYEEIPKHATQTKEIAIVCTNDERYFIDGASINSDVKSGLSELSKQQRIHLLIHPNADTIVELSSENGVILPFDETIRKLEKEATGFLFLGLLMYLCSLVGLYHIIKKLHAKNIT